MHPLAPPSTASRRPGPLPSLTLLLGVVLLALSGLATVSRPSAPSPVDPAAEATTSGDPTTFPATMAADEDPQGIH